MTLTLVKASLKKFSVRVQKDRVEFRTCEADKESVFCSKDVLSGAWCEDHLLAQLGQRHQNHQVWDGLRHGGDWRGGILSFLSEEFSNDGISIIERLFDSFWHQGHQKLNIFSLHFWMN